jgi:hypothetical protein
MRTLTAVLVVQLALAGGFIALVATDSLPFSGGDDDDGGSAQAARGEPRARVNRFDGRAAFRFLREQVEMGPRPAGSATSRRLAARLRRALPNGRYQAVPGGLRNVIGVVRGRDRRRVVVVGAHYDSKDIPGFVGANDGASGTAIVTKLARTIRPRRLRPTVVFILFDGEEAPRGVPDEQFLERGLRGSKVAAPRYRNAEAMILLDFVGEKRLRLPRETSSDPGLWRRLRAAARRVGVGRVFPNEVSAGVLDDHVPFIQQGVPSIDLIDFDFDCFHRTCDDMSVVSVYSVDAVGEAVLEMLRRL